ARSGGDTRRRGLETKQRESRASAGRTRASPAARLESRLNTVAIPRTRGCPPSCLHGRIFCVEYGNDSVAVRRLMCPRRSGLPPCARFSCRTMPSGGKTINPWRTHVVDERLVDAGQEQHLSAAVGQFRGA